MQCFNYEIRIRAKQGFASSNIERSLSLPCEFWMKKQTSLESNQTESYLWVTCKWLLILTGSGSIAVSRVLAEFSPRLPKRPTLSIVCGFSYKPWPTVQYFNIIEQFWKTCWSRISLCNCYRGFWGIRHFEWTINTVKRGDLGNSTLLIILATSRLLPKIISDTFDKCLIIL